MTERKGQADRRRRRGHPPRSRVWPWVIGVLGGMAVVAVIAVLSRLGGDGGVAQSTTSEPRQVGAVAVSASRIDLGRVPLDQWVNPTFRLRNVGAEPATVNIPRQGVETLEGC